jgi:hypothetical protein
MKNVFLYQAMMRGKNILKFAPKVENLDLSNNGMQTIPVAMLEPFISLQL